jgi:hypothetical protein
VIVLLSIATFNVLCQLVLLCILTWAVGLSCKEDIYPRIECRIGAWLRLVQVRVAVMVTHPIITKRPSTIPLDERCVVPTITTLQATSLGLD